MSDLMLPGPAGPDATSHDDAASQDKRREESTGRRRRPSQGARSAIPSSVDCLKGIAQLTGLLALGLIKPAQANAIRAAFREILQYHKTATKQAEKTLSNADIMDILRKDPRLLSLLEPLLTEEQIDMVMRNTEKGRDGQA
jgi:hypothetical protein